MMALSKPCFLFSIAVAVGRRFQVPSVWFKLIWSRIESNRARRTLLCSQTNDKLCLLSLSRSSPFPLFWSCEMACRQGEGTRLQPQSAISFNALLSPPPSPPSSNQQDTCFCLLLESALEPQMESRFGRYSRSQNRLQSDKTSLPFGLKRLQSALERGSSDAGRRCAALSGNRKCDRRECVTKWFLLGDTLGNKVSLAAFAADSTSAPKMFQVHDLSNNWKERRTNQTNSLSRVYRCRFQRFNDGCIGRHAVRVSSRGFCRSREEKSRKQARKSV